MFYAIVGILGGVSLLVSVDQATRGYLGGSFLAYIVGIVAIGYGVAGILTL